MNNPITITATVNAPINLIWQCWNEPDHIKNWGFATDDWEVPAAANDIRLGGRLEITMAAKDKSASFTFGGTYTAVEPNSVIAYTMDDDRKVEIKFSNTPDGVLITESFEAENQMPREMQEAGWQQILNNFKKYVESLN